MRILSDAFIPELPNHYRGKVRENYDLPDGRRIIIATDRLSAFDIILTAIPFKGEVLTQTARYWFEETADICPNHVLDYPDPNVVVGTRLDILPVEIVVRGYLAGSTSTSILTQYRAGGRHLYGITLPDGLRDNEKLPEAIITPTSKAADGGHDEPLSQADILEQGLLTQKQWETVSDYALAPIRERSGARGGARADPRRHQIRVRHRQDGRDRACRRNPHARQQPLLDRGKLRPSLRKRPAAGEFRQGFYPVLGVGSLRPVQGPDPEDPRRDRNQASQVYIQAYEAITGKAFAPDTSTATPLDRIRANLKSYF